MKIYAIGVGEFRENEWNEREPREKKFAFMNSCSKTGAFNLYDGLDAIQR
jgi:hypothetical protein